MTAAFRSLSSAAYGGGHVNTTLAPPAGLQDGDLLILVHLIAGSPGAVLTPVLPAGFTLLTGFPSVTAAAGFEVDTRIAYKWAASEAGDYVVTHAAATSEGTLIAISGGQAGVPACTVNSGLGATSTALGLTTGGADSLVAFIAHNWELYGSASPPAGATPPFVERLDSAAQLTYVATGSLATAGPTGDKTQANLNAGGDGWAAFLLEVRTPAPPAAAGRVRLPAGVF